MCVYIYIYQRANDCVEFFLWGRKREKRVLSAVVCFIYLPPLSLTHKNTLYIQGRVSYAHLQHLSAVFFILLTFKQNLYELLLSCQLFLQMEEKLAKLNLSEAETKQDNQRLARVCKKKVFD